MSFRYILTPDAARDLVGIWRYIKRETSIDAADRIEAVIRDRIRFLAMNPGIGHIRTDLTDANVRFFGVYSYLIVYHPNTNPLQIVSVLHGYRDVQGILEKRI
jgi:plasmid stabilization system protein ParE